ncbi:MAG TPA: transcriptional repressor [Deltaproteobacteria bacterium]|nr:transcriptional repressor [Deltaproteobacteria bacterium]
MRITKQRKLILEELERAQDHPTAYEVYERVRSRLPQISLGTVYRNLDVLSSTGAVKRLDMGQGQRRFDIIQEDHRHIRCISCGRVDDIPLHTGDPLNTIISTVRDVTGYTGISVSMDFHGTCPQCAKHGKVYDPPNDAEHNDDSMNNRKNKEE